MEHTSHFTKYLAIPNLSWIFDVQCVIFFHFVGALGCVASYTRVTYASETCGLTSGVEGHLIAFTFFFVRILIWTWTEMFAFDPTLYHLPLR